MSNEEKYNGWTNYETWAVNLWLTNNQGIYLYMKDRATEAKEEDNRHEFDKPEYRLAGKIQWHCDNLLHTPRAYHGLPGFARDLLEGALEEVNWTEIAEHFLED